MSRKSTSTRYGSVAVAIHWTSAAAIVLAFAAGWVVANVAAPAGQPPILIAHIALGTCVLLLTLLRIVWWLVADQRPAPPAGQPEWQRTTAGLVHGALYLIVLVMAASGIVTVLLSGAIPAMVAGGPVPDFSGLAPRLVHGLLSRLLLLLLAVHVGAVLYHHFVRGDRLLARMGIGSA
jgi:cytochrome b561